MPSSPWSPEAKRWLLAAGLAIIGLFMLNVWPIFVPFILATVLAYLLNPIVNFLHGTVRLPRGLATALVFLNLLILLAILPVAVVPAVVRQVQGFNVDLEALPRVLEDRIAIYEQYQRFEVDGYVIELPTPEEIGQSLERNLTQLGRQGGRLLFGFASGAAQVAITLLLVLVLAFYLVKDTPAILSYFRGLVPPDHAAEFNGLTRRLDEIWAAYFRGQLLLAATVAVVVSVGLALLGVPRAILLGLLAGLMEVVPGIGPVLAAIPAVLSALILGSSHLPLANVPFALVVLLFYVVLQQLENNLLVPRILGRSVALHPVVVLLAILAGASVAGILGVLLAVPLLASLRVLGGYAWRKIVDMEPYVPPPPPTVQESRAAAREEGEAAPGRSLEPRPEGGSEG